MFFCVGKDRTVPSKAMSDAISPAIYPIKNLVPTTINLMDF